MLTRMNQHKLENEILLFAREFQKFRFLYGYKAIFFKFLNYNTFFIFYWIRNVDNND